MSGLPLGRRYLETSKRIGEPGEGDQADKILSNAPDAREGFFAVPKVVE